MDDAFIVRVREGIRHLPHHAQRGGSVQGGGCEIIARDVLHRDVWNACKLGGLVDLHDGRVAQAGRHAGFTKEPLHLSRAIEAQVLERHRSSERRVARQIDGATGTLAQAPLDDVFLGDRRWAVVAQPSGTKEVARDSRFGESALLVHEDQPPETACRKVMQSPSCRGRSESSSHRLLTSFKKQRTCGLN